MHIRLGLYHMYVSVRTVMPRLVILLVLITQLAACSLLGDRRDAPWDPKQGRGIGMDQIPNWSGEANKVCGGHLPPEERKGRSPRC
jgi:transposase